jgi:hypothetical protein
MSLNKVIVHILRVGSEFEVFYPVNATISLFKQLCCKFSPSPIKTFQLYVSGIEIKTSQEDLTRLKTAKKVFLFIKTTPTRIKELTEMEIRNNQKRYILSEERAAMLNMPYEEMDEDEMSDFSQATDLSDYALASEFGMPQMARVQKTRRVLVRVLYRIPCHHHAEPYEDDPFS